MIRDDRPTNEYPSSIDMNIDGDRGWEESQLTFDGHNEDDAQSGGIIPNDYHRNYYDDEHTPNVKISVRQECDRSEGRGDEDGGSHYSRCGAQEEERSLYDEQQYAIHGDEDPTMPFDNDADYDYYDDVGEEHSHIATEHGVPMNEILVREVSNDAFENIRDEENFNHSLEDDDRNNYDIFSQHDELEYQQDGIFNVQSHDDDDYSLDSEQDTGFQTTANSILPTPVFRTSESIDVIHRIESIMLNIIKSLDKFECVLRGYVNIESQENGDDDESNDNVGEDEVEAFFGVAAAGGDPKFHRNFITSHSHDRSFLSSLSWTSSTSSSCLTVRLQLVKCIT